MFSDFNTWLHAKADILSAAAAGGIMAVAFGWQNPLRAARQLIAGLGCGWFIGPAWASAIETVTPFHGDAVFTSCVFAAGLCGLWIVEGLIFAANKWSKDPKLPGSFPWTEK